MLSVGDAIMERRRKSEGELAQLIEALPPLEHSDQLPMPRFGQAKPPLAQPLPGRGRPDDPVAKAAPVLLQWVGDELGLRALIEIKPESTGPEAAAVWATVETEDPTLAGKSAS